ncbi:MAG: metallophosphoesterase [candidate division WOR-3 bacterium]|nr:metallophosphoesterase [candidate division WOR-3 bacterium]
MNSSNLIGIISDTHDNLPNIKRAVEIFNQHKVSLVLHCGDFVAPFTLLAFKELRCPLLGVFGNCDGEKEYLLTQAKNLNFSIYEPPYITTDLKKRILITHKPVTFPEDIDILIYGHTHKPEVKYQQTNSKLIINPGEASGWLYNNPTIAILNLSTNQVEIIDI